MFADRRSLYQTRQSGNTTLKLAIWFVGAVVIGTVIAKMNARPAVSPLAATAPAKKQQKSILGIFDRKKDPEALRKKIVDAVGNQLRNYSVVVHGFSDDFDMSVNSTIIYTGASVNKLAILAALYDLANKGAVNLDQVITLQQEEIQDYGTGSIRYDKPGTTYSVKTLAKLMMQQSDNTAAYILANEIVGMDTIQKRLGEWGMTQTDMVNNKTSNADMVTLLTLIKNEKIAPHALTLEMLAFMKDTDFEDRIPADLPKGVAVYHKTGNGQGFVHDVGLVESPDTQYAVGIMAGDVTDEIATAKLQAQISRIIYDFMK